MTADSVPFLVSVAAPSPFAQAGEGGNAFGFGGTYAHNQLNQLTQAYVENAGLTATPSMCTPIRTTVLGVAASGGGSSSGSAAFAGGVTLSIFHQRTYAFVGTTRPSLRPISP